MTLIVLLVVAWVNGFTVPPAAWALGVLALMFDANIILGAGDPAGVCRCGHDDAPAEGGQDA